VGGRHTHAAAAAAAQHWVQRQVIAATCSHLWLAKYK